MCVANGCTIFGKPADNAENLQNPIAFTTHTIRMKFQGYRPETIDIYVIANEFYPHRIFISSGYKN